MDLVSKREFARRVGVSHTAINKAVETGRLCYANGTRLLDYETARGHWFDGSDVSKMSDARLSEFEKQRAVYLKDTRSGSQKKSAPA